MTFPCPKCGSVIKTMPDNVRTLKCRSCHHVWLRPIEHKPQPLRWSEAPAPNDGSAIFGYHRSNLIDEED